MSDNSKSSNSNYIRVNVVPFTGGVFAIYAFFWPESFGTWFGTIIHFVRAAGGF